MDVICIADLPENLIYLVATFFGLVVIGLVYVIVINGAFTPLMQNIVNSPNIIQMDNATKSSVLGGFSQVNIMLKLLIPGLFIATLIAVVVFILFKREEENSQI